MICVDALEFDSCEVQTESPGVKNRGIVPRILIVDDQEEIRQTVASMLQDEFEIVGLAGNGKQALEFVASRSPDVLVLDVFMPVLNGIETAACLKASNCRARVLFVTVHEDPDFLNAAMSVGARGYVSKAHLATDLIPAIRSVMEGRIYVSSCMNLF
jgi:DNA-binding NarL/FixJ family response regulator